MSCKGVCNSLYPFSIRFKVKLWDLNGYKKCQICDYITPVIQDNDIRCKCCSTKFRRRVRVTIRKGIVRI